MLVPTLDQTTLYGHPIAPIALLDGSVYKLSSAKQIIFYRAGQRSGAECEPPPLHYTTVKDVIGEM